MLGDALCMNLLLLFDAQCNGPVACRCAPTLPSCSRCSYLKPSPRISSPRNRRCNAAFGTPFSSDELKQFAVWQVVRELPVSLVYSLSRHWVTHAATESCGPREARAALASCILRWGAQVRWSSSIPPQPAHLQLRTSRSMAGHEQKQSERTRHCNALRPTSPTGCHTRAASGAARSSATKWHLSR